MIANKMCSVLCCFLIRFYIESVAEIFYYAEKKKSIFSITVMMVPSKSDRTLPPNIVK